LNLKSKKIQEGLYRNKEKLKTELIMLKLKTLPNKLLSKQLSKNNSMLILTKRSKL
jgi:hypothetical protein